MLSDKNQGILVKLTWCGNGLQSEAADAVSGWRAFCLAFTDRLPSEVAGCCRLWCAASVWGVCTCYMVCKHISSSSSWHLPVPQIWGALAMSASKPGWSPPVATLSVGNYLVLLVQAWVPSAGNFGLFVCASKWVGHFGTNSVAFARHPAFGPCIRACVPAADSG